MIRIGGPKGSQDFKPRVEQGGAPGIQKGGRALKGRQMPCTWCPFPTKALPLLQSFPQVLDSWASLVHRLLNPLGFVRRSPDQLAFFKAVRAALAVKRRYLNHNGRVRQSPDGKTANRPRPGGLP